MFSSPSLSLSHSSLCASLSITMRRLLVKLYVLSHTNIYEYSTWYMHVCVCVGSVPHITSSPHTACLVLSVTGAGFERNHWIIYDSQWSTNWDAKWLWRRPLKQHRMPSVPACIYIHKANSMRYRFSVSLSLVLLFCWVIASNLVCFTASSFQ